jgi:hypothetical protein
LSSIQANQVILLLGAELGSITVLGAKEDDKWNFIIEVEDCAGAELLDEEVVRHVDRASSLEEAFKSLDRYRWYWLYPITVHADFRAALWKAVNDRLASGHEQSHILDRWRTACGLDQRA